MGSSFWSSLTSEVQALREALEEEPPDDDDVTSPSTSSGAGGTVEYDLIICPPGAVYVMPGALVEPSPQLSGTLCNAFGENVDRMFKIFHEPTFRAFMIEGGSYLGNDHYHPGNKALKAAVWFSATNTMSEQQCRMLFGQSREEQLQQFKRLADVALSQADLMNTNDLATLQAFATYLFAVRLTDGSRRMWTLTAMAVRIARAMGLHHETVLRSPFQTELRRRLWHQIRFLDIYSAMDRGSELLVTFGSFDTPLPRNTNDSDFHETSTSIPEYENGLTDMSYAHMVYDASYHTHRLTIPESKPDGETWQQRLELATSFEAKVKDKYLKYCDLSDPYQRLITHVAGCMISGMKLRAVRPMQQHVSSRPPRVDSPYVMSLALENLRNSERIISDPETAQWRWMVWVQWHALATALAGLCAIRDTELANEAWRYVEQAYTRSASHVADARNGMLWKPIEKLYKKATAFRDHGRTMSISKDNPFPSQERTASVPTAYPTNPPQQQQLQFTEPTSLPQQQALPGAMPTTGFLNSPMDITLSDTINNDFLDPSMMMGDGSSGIDIGNGDLSWMDFERIMEDMSLPPNPDLNASGMMGEMQWPQNVPLGEDWNSVLQQNMV
ncbi:hypothetical protein LTR37_008094 [Vermiconidia calcicola]|uniref:Uncharacterized protein n=1 Tax=Vermiconidia calcicola TaxID=1690605 RepID=A0ACC3NBR9_9PEZI|nr:hypothetical protein LTR37_008094 [Vermiconidia calcicola]